MANRLTKLAFSIPFRANPDTTRANAWNHVDMIYRTTTSEESTTASVLIVDDHAGFRTAAKALLEKMGLTVIGEAESGERAIEAIDELEPDVVLLDIQLPGIDGIEVARRCLARRSPPAVVLTSTRDATDYGRRLAAVSPAAFVAKTDLSARSLQVAIRSAG